MPFLWVTGDKPFHVSNRSKLKITCPLKYRIYFGEPLRFGGDPHDDETVIADKAWLVKQTIQDMLNRALRERKDLFL